MPHFHFLPLERSRCVGAVFSPVASLTSPQAAFVGISLEGPRWPETLLATCHLKGE
jgi:hypothetical protein